MNITKADIALNLSQELGFSKTQAKHFVNLFFEQIADTLEQGNDLKIPGLGNFKIQNKNARIGRNPRNGIAYEIPKQKSVKFKQSSSLKKLVNIELIESGA